MVYVLIIGLPVLFSYLSDKTAKWASYLLTFLAIATPIFFAAVRDTTIGTDVKVYAVSIYDFATTHNLLDFLNTFMGVNPIGFNLLSWVVCQTKVFAIYMGLIQALTIIPIYSFIYKKYRDKLWIAMIMYMLIIFPVSLNAMKQMIAVAWCLPSFYFIENKKPVYFFITIVFISLMFHMTAVFFLLLYPIVWLFKNTNTDKLKFLGKFQKYAPFLYFILILLILFIGAKSFVYIFSVLKKSYSIQLNSVGRHINIPGICMIMFLSVSYITYKLFNNDKKAYGLYTEQQVLLTICIFGFALIQLNTITDSLMRFSYYFFPFMLLYSRSLLEIKNKNLKIFLSAPTVLVSCVYFFGVCILHHGHEIYPYTSSILGLQ